MSEHKQLTVGSLFSGIGGLDLGLERAGMRVIWQSEIEPYACRVLNKHWPEVVNHGDIKRIKWEAVEPPDVICGGYPCQPFSNAGHRRGEEDPRHLWPWVRDAISRLRPRYAILENVRGHLSMGGLSVIGELASIGYDAEWRIVSAASVGAPHRRDRIIIVAYPNSEDEPDGSQHELRMVAYPTKRIGDERQDGDPAEPHDGRGAIPNPAGASSSTMAYTDTREVERRNSGVRATAGNVFSRSSYRGRAQGYDGWQWWESEPSVGRVAHGIPNRVDRLRGLGNAVVPQVAEEIGRLVRLHWEKGQTT